MFKGSLVALITPMKLNGEIDYNKVWDILIASSTKDVVKGLDRFSPNRLLFLDTK